jgi:hypothetical protein
MQTTQNAAGQLAGAETLCASASQIALLIEIAALAMEDSQRELAVKEAHRAYIRALNDFEARHGRVESRIDPLNPDHAEIIAFTKDQYDGYQFAKRSAYNIRRRLQSACRKAARVNAERKQESTQ